MTILVIVLLTALWVASCWFSAGIIDTTRRINGTDGFVHDTTLAKVGWYSLAGVLFLVAVACATTAMLLVGSL